MLFTRHYTRAGQDPFAGVSLRSVSGEDWLEYTVPRDWSAQAVDVLISKVFYKSPVPALTCRALQEDVPEWLCPSVADDAGLDNVSAEWRYRFEKDVREVINRVAGALTYNLFTSGLAQNEDEAVIFYDELRYMMIHQIFMPDMAIMQNVGLNWAYGLAVSYAPAQTISSIEGPQWRGGIGVAVRAAQTRIMQKIDMIENSLSLQGGDARAAVVLPVENSESPVFITQLRQADIDKAALQLGRRMLSQAMHDVMDACDRDSVFGFDPAHNGTLARAIYDAKAAGLEEAAISTAIEYARQGFESIDIETQADVDDDITPKHLRRVLSVSDAFVESALTGHGLMLYEGGEAKRHVSASKLWDSYGESLWGIGGPELFFRDSAQAANPVLAEGDFCRSASGGFVFLSGTAAPAGTLNVAKFLNVNGAVDTQGFLRAASIAICALDGALQDVQDAGKSTLWRPVGLSLTGLSGILMSQGLAYDSDGGRATAALLCALALAGAQGVSAQMAQRAGAFDRGSDVRSHVLTGIKNNIAALAGSTPVQKGVTRRPSPLHVGAVHDRDLALAVKDALDTAYDLARQFGLRHAHLTMMDSEDDVQTLLGAQTRGIAPQTHLVRFESDGAEAGIYGKKLNPAVVQALKVLGYSTSQLDDIYFYAVGHGTLLDAPVINHQSLRAKGFHQAALDALESALLSAQHIRYVFNKWTLGEDFCKRMLGFDAGVLDNGAFDMLAALGFSEDDIEAANIYCCGTLTLEGAPHLKTQHLPVFDCLFAQGSFAVRSVSPAAQIAMQAAIEPFLSGAVAHTIEVDHHASIDDMQKLALKAWELGVKNLFLYRQGCSLLAPHVPLRVEQTAQDSAENEEAQTQTGTRSLLHTG